MFSRFYLLFLALTSICITANLAADTQKTLDKETNLSAWILRDSGLELTLKQVFPEQIRAFYLARGFPKTTAEKIANSCMFQTIVKNSLQEGEPIHMDQALWQVKTDTQTRGIKLKSTWDKAWKNNSQIKPAARLAYRWATFPTKQHFEAKGDYNWGMTCFDLQPGTKFAVEIVWKLGNIEKSAWIHGLSCAQDGDSKKASD
jgi:hypothetical protein